MGVKVKGLNVLQRDLKKMVKNIEDKREALEIVGHMIEEETLRSFEEEKSPFGEPWKKSKRAIKESGQTLFITGRLKGSVSSKVTTDGNAVVTGTNMEYGKIHQFGGKFMPKRSYLPINSKGKIPLELMLDVLDRVERWILE